MDQDVIFEINSEHIAWLTLNRPQIHNAFDDGMIQKLMGHFKMLHENPSIRALIIKGNGSSFCAGADISWMKRSIDYSQAENYEDARKLSLMMYLLDTLPMPTIAAVHGAVIGGGVGIVACSDIVLSDFHAVFSLSETKIGLVPAVIAPYVLRAVGSRYARRYFLTGERFDASVARHIGLVHEVVDFDTINHEIDKVIHHILAGGPHAIGRAKNLIRQVTGDIPENIRIMTAELIANIRLSEEAHHGMAAFLNKITPPWVPKRHQND